MKYSELYDRALKNSFAGVKRDIDEVKAKNSLIDERLKNSFSNIKIDMDSLKESIEGIKAEKPIELNGLNGRLSSIESAVEAIKKDFSKDTGITRDLDIDSIKSELKALDEARIESEHSFEKAIDSLKEELDVDTKFKKLERKISKPVIKEVIIEKPVIKEVIKEKKVKASKKKGEKGTFSKMIDFFAED